VITRLLEETETYWKFWEFIAMASSFAAKHALRLQDCALSRMHRHMTRRYGR
jgi:hypothetical protein